MTRNRFFFLMPLLILTCFLASEITTPRVHAQDTIPRSVWSPDNQRLAVTVRNGAIVIGEGRILSQCHIDGTVSALAFSPDSTTLYLGTLQGELLVCDALKGRKPSIPQQTVPLNSAVNHFYFNQDGSRFYITTGTQSPEGTYLYDQNLTLLGQYDPFLAPAPLFLSNGTTLTFGREKEMLTLERNGEPTIQVGSKGYNMSPQVSADGQYLLGDADGDGQGVSVFDLDTGENLRTFEGAAYVSTGPGDYALISDWTTYSVVNFVTGETLIETKAEWRREGSLVLMRNDDSGLTLVDLNTGTLTPLAVNAEEYSQFAFSAHNNVLLFATPVMPELGTDIITYSLEDDVAEITHISQTLSAPPLTAAGRAFTVLNGEMTRVYDIDTGKMIYGNTIGDYNWMQFVPRPDGEGYTWGNEEHVVVQMLDGEAYIITLPK